MNGHTKTDRSTTVATATKTNQEVLVKRALREDTADRFYQSAFNKMIRHVKRAPGGRRAWIFYDAAHGTFKPWRQLTEPMQLAMEAGCPEEDVMAIVHCLAGMVHAFYANATCDETTVKTALSLAIDAEADEVKAQAHALADPSDANLERVLEATTTDNRADETLLQVCRRKLGQQVHHLRAF